MTTSDDRIYLLDLQVATEQADAASEVLDAHWGERLVRFDRPGSSATWFQLTFDQHVEARLAEAAIRSQLPLQAAAIRANRPRDWAAFWKDHFVRRRIGRGLEICPDWDREAAPPADGVIRLLLNPGLSFGTGDHFTTRFCLEQLERVMDRGGVASMLDLGTGSGILAIAAARLGVGTITAVDNDPHALDHARSNLDLNHIDGVELQVVDVLQDPLPGAADLVCANILSGPLLQAADAIRHVTRGVLLLSGIREDEADEVADAYRSRGLEEIARDGDGEWAGLVLQVPATQSLHDQQPS